MRTLTLFLVLLFGCASDEMIAGAPVPYSNARTNPVTRELCKGTIAQLPGQPTELHLREVWTESVGAVPDRCSDHLMRWVVVADDDLYKACEIDPAAGFLRGCQTWCDTGGEVWPMGVIRYGADFDPDMVAHEWAHWMGGCALGDVDKDHKNPTIWSTDGFVARVAATPNF